VHDSCLFVDGEVPSHEQQDHCKRMPWISSAGLGLELPEGEREGGMEGGRRTQVEGAVQQRQGPRNDVVDGERWRMGRGRGARARFCELLRH
jgi:hypothetical protein